MKTNNEVYLLLGSNLGESKKILSLAIDELTEQVGPLIQKSSLYESDAWGNENQSNFINQVVRISTILNPEKVLLKCLDIETKLGRVRFEKWGERCIDIDILYFNDAIVNSENLIIPHPYIQKRRFTMIPLVEIACDLIHPVSQKTQKEMLNDCQDPLNVTKLAN